MKIRRVVLLAGMLAIVFWVAGGCSDINQINDPEPAFETLVVAYGQPGSSPGPCDDLLPQIDGVAEDQEWQSA